jgi:7,8-dihydropterin-6-yl-methyl-4-(beta-D-ribofuranosyl)aminobenzene 5'-phosphate synthase
MPNLLPLEEVDSVEIISLIDNTVDFNSTNTNKDVQKVREWTRNRMGLEWTKKYFRLPFAEHGFSVIIKIFSQKKHNTILFDTGLSPDGVVTNATRMGIDLTEVECIILSHGHYDHFGGLTKVIKAIKRKNLPIIVHDDMFKIRGVINPDGSIREYPRFPSNHQVAPAKYLRIKQPYLLFENKLLVSGEIPRKTDFEKGFPEHYEYSNEKWVPDPWIWDDEAIIINVKHKGLIIISGCAHAGIANTTLFGQHITKVNKVNAIIGGCHLAGKNFEPRINKTVEKIQRINPTIIVPMHCTGWRGKKAFFEAMPQAFVWNSVGNIYHF